MHFRIRVGLCCSCPTRTCLSCHKLVTALTTWATPFQIQSFLHPTTCSHSTHLPHTRHTHPNLTQLLLAPLVFSECTLLLVMLKDCQLSLCCAASDHLLFVRTMIPWSGREGQEEGEEEKRRERRKVRWGGEVRVCATIQTPPSHMQYCRVECVGSCSNNTRNVF